MTTDHYDDEHRKRDTPSSGYRALWLPDLAWIGLLLIAATVPFFTPTLDLRLISVFHHSGSGRPWPDEFHPVWRALYTVGTWPALITALTGLGLVVAALYRRNLVRWRRHAAFLFLTLALGPGLFVNTLFKDHWGRPRPRQVTELGGTLEYRCFYEKGTAGQGKSFPCGHSSMGYYFVVFYFLARRHKRALGIAAWCGAMAYGTLIGASRMAAGAHFASDVLWSAVFPCFIAWLLYYFILRIPQFEDDPEGTASAPFWRTRWLVWVAPPLGAATIAAVLLGTPSFTAIRYDMKNPGHGPITLRLDVEKFRITLTANTNLQDRIIIQGEAHGFGWPWSRIRHKAEWILADGSSVWISHSRAKAISRSLTDR